MIKAFRINYLYLYILIFLGSNNYLISLSDDIEIVELLPEEWHLYRDLRLESVYNNPEAFGTSYKEELLVTEDEWKYRLSHNMLFAKYKDQVVGMIGAVLNTAEKKKHLALVISFYVSPEFRNQGVGAKLLSAIIDRLKTFNYVKIIMLYVTTKQLAVINLYKKFKFHIHGVLENAYMYKGVFYDQFIMSRNVDV